MAFHYTLKVPSELGPLTITKWCLNEWESVQAGQTIAELHSTSKKYVAIVNGPGVLWKRLARAGVELTPEAIFAQVAAEGEDIPYGRPYVIFEESFPG